MDLNRRQIIKGIGAALCAGVVPKFCVELIAPVDSHALHVAAHVDALKTWLPTPSGFVTLMEYYRNDGLPDPSVYTYIQRDDGTLEILTRPVSYSYGEYTVTHV